MPSDRTISRIAALFTAACLEAPAFESLGEAVREVTTAADGLYTWLTAPSPIVSLQITADPPADRPPRPTTPEGTIMALQFPDTQEVTLHVTALDAEGETAPDTVTWTVDNGAVLVLTPSADTMSCLAVPGTAPGAATVSATDPAGNTATFAIEVVNGPVTSFAISADTPVDRPAAAPAPAAPAAEPATPAAPAGA